MERQSLAGKLVDAVFILVVGALLYTKAINEWAGILLLGGIAQARGAVGVAGKLSSLIGGGPPPSDRGDGGAGGGGGSSSGPRRGGGGMWRKRAEGLALTSAVVLAGSSVFAPLLLALSRARSVGLLAALAFCVACVR